MSAGCSASLADIPIMRSTECHARQRPGVIFPLRSLDGLERARLAYISIAFKWHPWTAVPGGHEGPTIEVAVGLSSQ